MPSDAACPECTSYNVRRQGLDESLSPGESSTRALYAISIVLAACLFAGSCSSAAVRSRREVTVETTTTVSHSSGTTFAVAVRPANDVRILTY